MAKSTHLYEVLFRFDENGLKGSHAIFIDRFTDDETGQIVQSYTETLPNGVSYSTLDVNLSSTDNTRVFEVPEDHYFMMGDNRDNSSDSRLGVGFVPLENFVGKANVVFFSIRNEKHPLAVWEWPENLRLNRFFMGL